MSDFTPKGIGPHDRISEAYATIQAAIGPNLNLTFQADRGGFVIGAEPTSEKAKKTSRGLLIPEQPHGRFEFLPFVRCDTIEDVASVLFGMSIMASMIDRGFAELSVDRLACLFPAGRLHAAYAESVRIGNV